MPAAENTQTMAIAGHTSSAASEPKPLHERLLLIGGSPYLTLVTLTTEGASVCDPDNIAGSPEDSAGSGP